MQKARYSKENVAEYYLQNREAIKKKSIDWYKNLSKEKDKIIEYQRKDISNWFSTKKEAL